VPRWADSFNEFSGGASVERKMRLRLGLLLFAVTGCASAPVRDDNLERIETAMAPEQGELPAALPMGEAPPLAAPDPYAPPLTYSRHGRMYRHLSGGQSDFYTGNVTVPAVISGTHPVWVQ